MGHQDIASLFVIKGEIRILCKKNNLDFSFKVDLGNYETALEFVGVNVFHPPISKDWSTSPIILCPDLLDYHHRMIIEYEEEIGNRRAGAQLAKKGHNREGDFDNSRDSRRNKFYKRGGFHVLRLWESDKNWKEKLEEFLLINKSNDIR
jgi:hypothetical protein